jgi:hypothetical protein
MVATRESHTEEAYKVRIITSKKMQSEFPDWFQGEVVASVPEDGFSLSVESEWEAPLEAGGKAVSVASQLSGSGFTTQVRALNKHIWTGNNPISIDLSMNFVTVSDPLIDVMQPAMSVMMLPLPIEGNERKVSSIAEDYNLPEWASNAVGELSTWFLKSPVDTKLSGQGERSISVDISSQFTFDHVLPESADIDFNSTYCRRPNSNESWPVSAEVSFSFLASQSPVRNLQDSGMSFNLSDT